jgi:hypothetical protein
VDITLSTSTRRAGGHGAAGLPAVHDRPPASTDHEPVVTGGVVRRQARLAGRCLRRTLHVFLFSPWLVIQALAAAGAAQTLPGSQR